MSMQKKIRETALFVAVLFFLTSVMVHAGDIAPQLQSVLDVSGQDDEIAVIIELNGKLDRKQFKKFKRKLRRFELLKQLRKKAAANKAILQSSLQGSGAKNIRQLWIINGMALKAKPEVIKKLAKHPEVMEVRLDLPVPLINNAMPANAPVEWNIAMVGADLLWAQGYQGQGVVIASMDSGVDYQHTELAGNWRGGTNSWFDPHGEHATPYDANGHGTQAAGIMFGQNLGASAIGMAPSAQWIAVKVFADNGDALASDVHAGFQWLLDPDNDPNTDDAPDIINNSWGFPETVGTCDTEFTNDIQMFRDLDISVVFSAGNLGAGQTDSSPANYPNVFAVGAVDQNQLITSFSSQGPSSCGQPASFPAAVAPGYLINTTDLTFGGLFANATTLATGTSFAAPHVTGAMALLLSADPTLTPADLESVIRQSSFDLGSVGDDNVFGSGLVNAADAFNLLGQPPPPPQCTDGDGDGFFVEATCGTAVDCNDADASVYPDAQEIQHDGIDQNCNGYDLTIDIVKAHYRSNNDKLIIQATSTYGIDAGLVAEVPGLGTIALSWQPTKLWWQKTIWQAAANGLQVDNATIIGVSGAEGATGVNLTGDLTAPPPPQCTDADGDGYFVEATCGTAVDCNDMDATVYPGAPEIENDGIDQDCDGQDFTTTTTGTAKAVYRMGGDKLILQATSSAGADANLMADIPGIGTIALSWQPSKQWWQKTIWQATTQGLLVDTSTIITIHGAGSSTSVNLVIK